MPGSASRLSTWPHVDRHRDRTGEGQRVEVDLLSSLLAGLANQASAYTAAGVVATRMGNAHPSIAPYEPLATADGELVLAFGNDRQSAHWRRRSTPQSEPRTRASRGTPSG
jgi:crotonobetainyl-CoA:carnitine CoA-transferase CaiB-like acyl-CoA transferase